VQWLSATTVKNCLSLFATAGGVCIAAGRLIVAKENPNNEMLSRRIVSMDAHDMAQAALENAIHAYESAMDGDGKIITSWIVVAEWINADGEEVLAAFTSPCLTYWKANGMLEAAPYQIVYEDDDEDDD
jgi:hypothetical protein